MRRATLVVAACVCALMFSGLTGFAEDRVQGEKASAAAPAPAAPADAGDKAADMKGGCPADGSCCGAPECTHGTTHHAAGEGASADGGCPCMKNKQQKAAP